MATLGNTVLTLADWAKRLDPGGKIDRIVEMLGQTNEILSDMQWREGNLPTGHRTTVRTGLPAVTWRLLNAGVIPSKSSTAQVDEQSGMLEAFSEVDKDLAMMNGDTAAFRLSEASSFLESMNQEMAQTLFYGNSGVAPEEITGLAARFSTISGATNAQNVIDAGGTGSDNTSIWLVVWGEGTVFGIFPNGSRAGIIHEDHGEKIIQTGTGIGTGRMVAYVDRWQWKAGIAMRDWRYVVRAANIDVSNLVAESSAADILKIMTRMIHRIPAMGMGRPVFYANRTLVEMLDIQAQQRTNVLLAVGQEEGRPKLSFRGIPVRKVDQLLNTEARVV